MTLNRVWLPCPNYSSRGGQKVRLVVVHTTEGASSYQNLSAFFNGTAGTSNPTSSHVGIDDTPNTVGEYVSRPNKAWTQGNANPVAVGAELCAFAKWDRATWQSHPTMLSNTAQWISEECANFGIPKVKLTAAQAQGGSAGVCGHMDLGAWGGGHSDPGTSFPWDLVLSGSTPTPTPPSPQPSPITGEDMICTDPTSNGVWVVASKEGAVYCYDGAPYIGATNNTAMNAGKYPCVGLDTYKDPQGQVGLIMVLDWGDRGDGSGKSTDGGDRFRRYKFPRNGSGKAKGGTY
jgi:N-acetylmuramoyl-L-alanine amidase